MGLSASCQPARWNGLRRFWLQPCSGRALPFFADVLSDEGLPPIVPSEPRGHACSIQPASAVGPVRSLRTPFSYPCLGRGRLPQAGSRKSEWLGEGLKGWKSRGHTWTSGDVAY